MPVVVKPPLVLVKRLTFFTKAVVESRNHPGHWYDDTTGHPAPNPNKKPKDKKPRRRKQPEPEPSDTAPAADLEDQARREVFAEALGGRRTEAVPLTEGGERMLAMTSRELRGDAKFKRVKTRSLHGARVGTVTVGPDRFFYKGVGRKEAEREADVTAMFNLAGVRAPAVRSIRLPGAPSADGTGGQLTEWVEGKTLMDWMTEDGMSRRDIQNKLRPGEFDRHILMCFLLGIGDRHMGNFMWDGSDQLTAIDFEFSLGRLYDQKEMLDDLGATSSQCLQEAVQEFFGDYAVHASVNDKALKQLIKAADTIADDVARFAPEFAEEVRGNVAVLKAFAEAGGGSYFKLMSKSTMRGRVS